MAPRFTSQDSSKAAVFRIAAQIRTWRKNTGEDARTGG